MSKCTIYLENGPVLARLGSRPNMYFSSSLFYAPTSGFNKDTSDYLPLGYLYSYTNCYRKYLVQISLVSQYGMPEVIAFVTSIHCIR